jgi:FtsZ-interacting cell division protein ZipA
MPAFIALVVILVVVTIISTAGIVYMLWDKRQDNDKDARVRRYKSTRAEDSGWMARLVRVFRSRKPEPLHRRETSDKEMMQDWAQSAQNTTSTRDILATIREEQSEHQPEDAYSTTDIVTPSTRSPAVSILDTYHRVQRPVPSRCRGYAASHLSTSEGSTRSMSVASYRSRQDSSGPHMQPSIPSIAEHLVSPSLPSSSPSMSPSPLIQRLGSPDSFDTIYPNGRGRPFATQSGTSITLEGGTKFREEL